MADPRRTDPRHPTGQQRGGIPDGLLLALLAFLLGLAVLVWSATGLAAWITRGAWPGTVTFGHTPAAIRALIAQPHDVAGAWPDTDPAALSGWGLFWGTFISQLLVLFVATVFVIGVVARTKSRRAQARQAPEQPPAPEPAPFPVQPVTAYEPPRPAPRPAAPQPPPPRTRPTATASATPPRHPRRPPRPTGSNASSTRIPTAATNSQRRASSWPRAQRSS